MKGPETGREVQDWTKRRRLSNIARAPSEAWKVPPGSSHKFFELACFRNAQGYQLWRHCLYVSFWQLSHLVAV